MTTEEIRNILIAGGGGREDAVGYAFRKDRRVGKLYFAPGNAGTLRHGVNIPIGAKDTPAQIEFARTNGVNRIFIGPDDPLAEGAVDKFKAAGFKVFGPTKAAAQIEASKAFSKRLMWKKGIRTAPHRTFADPKRAFLYAHAILPCMVKASGLALGKGAYACHTVADINRAIQELMIDAVHGPAGKTVIVEKFLPGMEFSAHAICAGTSFISFPFAMDHKHDMDPELATPDKKPKMTGGMGVIAPVPWGNPAVEDGITREVNEKVIKQVLEELAERGIPFSGCLYPGMMKTSTGQHVLEFNARFGDPETQVYMRLLDSPLLDLVEGSIDGTLGRVEVRWRKGFAVCIIMASAGYPGPLAKKNVPITFDTDPVFDNPDVEIFHSGTALIDDQLVTADGRVLGVTAYHGESLEEALALAYSAVSHIHFEGAFFRDNIGRAAIEASRLQVVL